MNRVAKTIAIAALGLTMTMSFAACNSAKMDVSVSEDGYLIVNGDRTEVRVGQDGQNGQNGEDGVNGKSAYELYVDANPDYTGDEAQWLDDLAAGKLSKKVYELISYGRNCAATTVKGTVTVSSSAAEVSLSGAVLALNEPVILPLGEHASWEISFGGTLMPGGNGGGQILTSCAASPNGRVYIGTNAPNNALFMGVCIEGFYANYCWDVPSSLFAESHDYTISYSEGNYLLSIDGGEQKALSKLNINQNNVTAVNGVDASHELTKKIRAVTGQSFVKMTHIGADSHTCTNIFNYYKIMASPVYGYEELASHPLRSKTIFYLGSSVTRGHGGDTDGTSFADITHKLTGNVYQKEAISGTTLALRTNGDNSYASRLSKFDLSKKPDVLVVQLSTNDFSQGITLGTITADSQTASASFDKTTMTGAIEYIVAAVKEQSPNTKVVLYACPLGSNYGSRRQYGQYVDGTLKQLERKWDNLCVLDLFSGGYLNVPAAYMQGDDLHPTKAGYAQVFTPALINLLAGLL